MLLRRHNGVSEEKYFSAGSSWEFDVILSKPLLMRLDLKEVGNKNMSRSLFSTYVSK
jgi:hypothetical protein